MVGYPFGLSFVSDSGSGFDFLAVLAVDSDVVVGFARLGGGLLLLMVGMGIYNSLVALRERYKNAFSQIEVQLKRRYDLIPNLVETAKGVHEA